MSVDPHRTYEIRCPVYGFITVSDWERKIISQPAFQRLRRIRQLAWSDYVYPGAMHTRFEHSLGVMHMATQLYRSIADRSPEILRGELGTPRLASIAMRRLYVSLLYSTISGTAPSRTGPKSSSRPSTAAIQPPASNMRRIRRRSCVDASAT
jgi:hypothetical protein